MPRRAHPSLFDDSGLPEGFVYREDVVTEAEEAELLPHIRQLEFGAVLMHGVTARRRVVQFGYRYGFDERRLEPTTAIPDYLLPLRERAAALAGILVESFSEALVTEYPPGATIGWHRDAPDFGVIAGVSLAAACRFRFRRGEPGAWETTEIVAAPRSAYVLAGPARTVWQHSIPAVPHALLGDVSDRSATPWRAGRRANRGAQALIGLSRFDLKYSCGTLPHEQLITSIRLFGTRELRRVRDLLATEVAGTRGVNPEA